MPPRNRSMFDSEIQLTSTQGAISIMIKGWHAVLITEKLDDQNGYELRCSDLVQAKNTTDYSYDYYYLLDHSISDGTVRSSVIRIGSLEEFKQHTLTKNIDLNLFTTTVIALGQLSRMHERIREDIVEQNSGRCVQFSIQGLEKSNGKGHNCITWVESLYSIVGMSSPESSNLTSNSR